MALTKTDKEFIQQSLTGVNAKSQYFHDIILEKLVPIDEKLTKQNGRVFKLEEKEAARNLFCSNVQAVKNERETQALKRQGWINRAIAAGMFILALLAFAERRTTAINTSNIKDNTHFVDSTRLNQPIKR